MHQYMFVKEMLGDGKAGKVYHMIDISNENTFRAITSIEAFTSRWLDIWYRGNRLDQCRYGSLNEEDIYCDCLVITNIRKRVGGENWPYPDVLCYDSMEEFFTAIGYDKAKSSRKVITFTNGVKYTSANGNQKGNM